MRPRAAYVLASLLHGACFAGLSFSAEEPPAGPPPTFRGQVKAILDAHCTGCHGRKNLEDVDRSGGLALDTLEEVLKAGVVVPGDPGRSELLARLRERDPADRMPREAPALPADTVALIERWIAAGAPRGEETGTARAGPVPEAGTAPPARPRRVRQPLDLRLPIALRIPPGSPFFPADFPREKLEFRLRVGPLPPITAVAFSPVPSSPAPASPGASSSGAAAPGAVDPRGGPSLLAAATHGRVVIWDLERAEATAVVRLVPGTVHAVRFSPDGRLLAAGGGNPGEGGRVAVLEAASRKTVHVLEGHRDAVLAVEFSPAGDLLASAGFDRTVRVWDLGSGKQTLVLSEHSDRVHALAFLAGGNLLASAGADRSIKIADLGQGKVVRSLAGHEKPVLALAASPDGSRLVSAGVEPALRFWDPGTGKSLRTAGGHSGRVEDLAWSREGRLLASGGSDRIVRLWEPESGKQIRSLSGATEWLHAVAIDPAARRAAAGAWDGSVWLWEVEKGGLLAVLLQPPAEEAPEWAVITPEGRFRASAALEEAARLGAAGRPEPEAPLAGLRGCLGDAKQIARGVAGLTVLPPLLGPERSY